MAGSAWIRPRPATPSPCAWIWWAKSSCPASTAPPSSLTPEPPARRASRCRSWWETATPVLTAAGNAASGKGALVAGSLALLTGSGLDGDPFSVIFDGLPADVVSKSSTAIQVVVPAALAGRASAQVVVSANSKSSAPLTVTLAAVAPAVFEKGILNADGTVNTEQNPEPPGGLLLVRATGLPAAGVTARIGDRDVLEPVIETVAGLPGILQVHVPVPGDFGGGATVILCAPDPASNEKVCTEPALLYVKLP